MKSWFITILFSVITIFAFSQGIEQRNALVTQKYNGEWLQHKLATDSAIINSSSNIYFYQDVIAREQFYDVGLKTPQSHVASYRPVFVDLSNGLLYSSVGSDSVIYSDTALYALNSDKLDGYHEDHFVDTIEWNGFLEELEDTIADIRSDISNLESRFEQDSINKDDSLMALREVIRDTVIAIGQEQWSIMYADTSRYAQIAGQIGSLGNCVDVYIDTIYPCSPVYVDGSIKAEDSIFIKDNFLYEYLPEIIGTRSGFHVEDSLEVKGKTLIGGDFPATNMLTVLNGNVGIGTTIATEKLHIYQVTGTTTSLIQNGNNTLEFNTTDNTHASIFSAGNSTGLMLGGTDNGHGIFIDSTSNGVSIGFGVTQIQAGDLCVNDFVGIGTTNPLNQLHVVGDAKITSDVTGTDSTVFINNGRIGVGTINPTASLHLIDSNNLKGLTIDYDVDMGASAIGWGLYVDNTGATGTTDAYAARFQTGNCVDGLNGGIYLDNRNTTRGTSSRALHIEQVSIAGESHGIYAHMTGVAPTGSRYFAEANFDDNRKYGFGIDLSFYNSTGIAGSIDRGFRASLRANQDTNIAVDIEAYGANNANYALITRAGRVGIGIAHPTELFNVGNGYMKLEHGYKANNIDTTLAGVVTTNDTSLATSSQLAKAINSVTTDYYSKTYIDSINNISATKAQYYSMDNLEATVDSATWQWFTDGGGTLISNDYEKNITLQNDTIFFDAEGKYRITYHFDCKMETSELSQFQMRLNNSGTPETFIAETIEFDMTNIPFEFDGSSVVDIANDNDWVILEVRNTASYNDFTTIGGHIEIERLLY